jgi:hypothetical protein
MRIRHPEWRAEHEPTKYPFSQDSTLVNDAGDVIFETTFLDASFYIIGAQPELHLSRISVDHETVTIYVGDGVTAQLASGSFARAAPPDELRFLDVYGRPAGLLVSETIRLALFSSWPFGDHDFSPRQTQFVARCCHAVPMVGVRGFELDDGNILTGDVWLVGDDGVVLTCDTVAVDADCGVEAGEITRLRIDIVGDSLFRRKLCSAPDFFETPHYLQTITFCAPGLLESYSSYVSSEISEVSSLSSCVPEPAVEDPVVDVLILTDTTLGTAPYLTDWATEWINHLIDFGILSDPLNALTGYDIKYAVADYKDYTDGAPFDSDGFRVLSPFDADPNVAKTAVAAQIASGGGDQLQEQLTTLVNLPSRWTDPSGLNGRANAYKLVIIGFQNAGNVDCPGGPATGLPYASFYPALPTCFDYTPVNAAILAAELTIIPVELPGAGISGFSQMQNVTSGTYFVDSSLGGFSGPFCFIELGNYNNCRTVPTASLYGWLRSLGTSTPGEPCDDVLVVTPIEVKTPIVRYFPATDTNCVKCGPGDFGDVKIFVHGQRAEDTILRIRPVSEGLKIETVGETIERKNGNG